MKTFFLVTSGVFTIFSVLPYIIEIVKGNTKPNIVSWLTWTILTGIATVAEIAAHEYVTAIFTGTAVIETALVVVFGLRYGYVKYSRFDVICQLGAVVGLILWWLYNSPAIAVLASVAIDFIGALPTFRHAYLKPHEETWSAFAFAGIGAGFAILALTRYNWTSLTYALYIVVVNACLTSVLLIQGTRMKQPGLRKKHV